MGLFLGWPIHRARGAPEEAPVLGQRQAGAACFPRQSTNAPERGAWRPWRAQPARAQPAPAAAAPPPPPPPVPPPSRAPGPRSPTPSPPSRGRRPLVAGAPGTARCSRAPRPALRALQTLSSPSFSSSPSSHLLLRFIAFLSCRTFLHLSISLSLLFPCSLSTLLLFPPWTSLSVLTTYFTLLGLSTVEAALPGSAGCFVPLCLSALISLSPDAPPGSAPGGLALGEGRMVPEVRVLSSLLGLALLWFPLDSHARARK